MTSFKKETHNTWFASTLKTVTIRSNISMIDIMLRTKIIHYKTTWCKTLDMNIECKILMSKIRFITWSTELW